MSPQFYNFAGGLVQRDDSRLLIPGDLTLAVGGELRPGSDSIFTTGYRKNAGTLGAGEHVHGSPLFAQYDIATNSRLIAGVGTGLFEAVPALTAMSGSAVTIDGATLAYNSTPRALISRQQNERIYIASGVGINVVVDGTSFTPRKQNLIRKADGTYILMSMIPPNEPPDVVASALTAVSPTPSTTSNSGWVNVSKAIEVPPNDDSKAYAIGSPTNPSRTLVVQFAAFTAASHKIKVLHSTGGYKYGIAIVVGAGGHGVYAIDASLKLEFSIDSGATWTQFSLKPVPYDEQWSEANIPDGSYGSGAVRVRITGTYTSGTANAGYYVNTIKCTNAPSTAQDASLGFRYVYTEWDDVNKFESAYSPESELVTMPTASAFNIVTVKLPPGMPTPGQRQNNRTTHWRVYRQPNGAAKGEFDKYGLVAEIPVSTSATFTVSAATNASPIEITTSANHGFATGDTVVITGALGNTAANGTWIITFVSATKFTLNGSTGSGTYTASSATVRRASVSFVDFFEKPLTEVARPVLRTLVVGSSPDITFYAKDAPHPIYKSIDFYKGCLIGVPVEDPSNVYFSPPFEYESRPSLYNIPSRTTRNDSPTGVKTIDDVFVIFFPDWTKRVQSLPLVVDGRFDPSNAAEASTTRGAAGPLAFDDFTMPTPEGNRWVCAADKEGVYVTNGYQFMPWTNNLTWTDLVNLGNDGNNEPYLARTIVRNNADKRRIEVYYVPAGGTAVTRRLDFYYGEGKTADESAMRQDGQPKVWGPHPSKARGAVTALVAGARARFTSTDGSAASGRICNEDAASFFQDDSQAVDVSGTVSRILATGDLAISGLGQDGYLRSVALRTVRGTYQIISETVSMEFSDGEKRVLSAVSQDPSAPTPTGVFAAGETLQYMMDDSGTTEKTVVLGIYVETRAWGGEGSSLRAAVGATAGSTALPTS